MEFSNTGVIDGLTNIVDAILDIDRQLHYIF